MATYETQADRTREISDGNLIDASFTAQGETDLIDTPAVMAVFEADEEFHKNLKREAAAKARKASARRVAA